MGLVGKSAILDKEKGTFTIDEAVVPDPGPGEVLVLKPCVVYVGQMYIYIMVTCVGKHFLLFWAMRS